MPGEQWLPPQLALVVGIVLGVVVVRTAFLSRNLQGVIRFRWVTNDTDMFLLDDHFLPTATQHRMHRILHCDAYSATRQ